MLSFSEKVNIKINKYKSTVFLGQQNFIWDLNLYGDRIKMQLNVPHFDAMLLMVSLL